MLADEEFLRWLRRPEKTFTENFQFAIKSWLSAEFISTNKYEIVLKWLTENETLLLQDFNLTEFEQLFDLQAPPTLISQQVKTSFVEMCLKIVQTKQNVEETRCLAEFLYKLSEYELLQDLFRFNYDIYAKVYAALFKSYECYLHLCITKSDNIQEEAVKPQRQKVNGISVTSESEFFATVFNTLNAKAKLAGDTEKFENSYSLHTLPALVNVMLVLRKVSSAFGGFFEDLLLLERTLTERVKESKHLKRVFSFPLHVRLMILECAIVNRRGVEIFLRKLVTKVFKDNEPKNPALALTAAAYTLEIFHKHEVSLNVVINETSQQTALQFVGVQLETYIKNYKENHLLEVLRLLCAALHFNPLVLEPYILKVATWMIMAIKNTAEEQKLFGEFLILLMDMFQKLSRVEKLVGNLLRTLKEWPGDLTIQTTRKRKMEFNENAITPKKIKEQLKDEQQDEEKNDAEKEAADDYYLEILFNGSKSSNDSSETFNYTNVPLYFHESFPYLNNHWPSGSVGVAFVLLVTKLVSKPSLVVWKSLLFSLKDLLLEFEQANELSANMLFHLDFHAALLCQYFNGSRLTEQYHQYTDDITKQQQFTIEVLKSFGNFILLRDYNKGTMNAFLECCFHATNLQLILHYYCPDGREPSLKLDEHLHSFLSTEQWNSMEQLILNANEKTSKTLYNRILLQRVQAFSLMHNDLEKIEPTEALEKFTNVLLACSAKEQYALLTHAGSCNKWIFSKMDNETKFQLINKFVYKADLYKIFSANLDTLELTIFALFGRLLSSLENESSSSSLLKTLNCDFNALSTTDLQATAENIKRLAKVITAHPVKYTLQELPREEVEKILKHLALLPVECLKRQRKALVFVLQLVLYRDLKAAEEEDLALQAFEQLTDFLHFGPYIPIFKYFSTECIFNLLPINNCWPFYEIIFKAVKNEEKGTDIFLNSLIEILKSNQAENSKSKLNEDDTRLLILAIQTLVSVSGQTAKRMRKYLDSTLEIYANHINAHFKVDDQTSQSPRKKDKKFVDRTLPGFAIYANNMLRRAVETAQKSTVVVKKPDTPIDTDKKARKTKKVKNAKREDADAENTEEKLPENDKEEQPEITMDVEKNHEHDDVSALPEVEIDENFRRICKIYIGHSMDNYQNPHAVHLLQVSLNYRQQLHLDQDEIEFVLNNFWRQINKDLLEKREEDLSEEAKKNMEVLLKVIIGYKTNEDLLLLLKEIVKYSEDEKKVANIIWLLKLMSKCPFSTIKGAIFNDQYKHILFISTFYMKKDDQQQFINKDHVLRILEAHTAIAANKKIRISTDTLDIILGFIMEINIRKFQHTESNFNVFRSLHVALTELCITLIKHRHLLLMDRVSQLMYIFKQLTLSIVWYKADRQKDIKFPDAEVDDLADLAMKLESLMHLIAAQSVSFKRIAPFVLQFVIHLMVGSKRPTTLYPKIKTHIENICYDLVGICDHRVGRFILRTSNDASRQVYENLVKEYKKYHKFKGEV